MPKFSQTTVFTQTKASHISRLVLKSIKEVEVHVVELIVRAFCNSQIFSWLLNSQLFVGTQGYSLKSQNMQKKTRKTSKIIPSWRAGHLWPRAVRCGSHPFDSANAGAQPNYSSQGSCRESRSQTRRRRMQGPLQPWKLPARKEERWQQGNIKLDTSFDIWQASSGLQILFHSLESILTTLLAIGLIVNCKVLLQKHCHLSPIRPFTCYSKNYVTY